MAVQFINAESFFLLRKFIGLQNPLLTARIAYFLILRRSAKNMAAKFKGRAKSFDFMSDTAKQKEGQGLSQHWTTWLGDQPIRDWNRGSSVCHTNAPSWPRNTISTRCVCGELLHHDAFDRIRQISNFHDRHLHAERCLLTLFLHLQYMQTQ